ncbi:MAG: hypothetical protein H6648_00790 [Caldilineae bacterium]|nr:hypothetical protein [Chloroflexota bacterium]MCB9175665.1 hypothetical protein [Caldilineae bacterium]
MSWLPMLLDLLLLAALVVASARFWRWTIGSRRTLGALPDQMADLERSQAFLAATSAEHFAELDRRIAALEQPPTLDEADAIAGPKPEQDGA